MFFRRDSLYPNWGNGLDLVYRFFLAGVVLHLLVWNRILSGARSVFVSSLRSRQLRQYFVRDRLVQAVRGSDSGHSCQDRICTALSCALRNCDQARV